jgi:hypothetical protein
MHHLASQRGRIGFGAQQRLSVLISPNRPSSWAMRMTGRVSSDARVISEQDLGSPGGYDAGPAFSSFWQA